MAGQLKKYASLLPHLVRSKLYDWRIDYRFGRGWAFSPAIVVLTPTLRCNLTCLMCAPSHLVRSPGVAGPFREFPELPVGELMRVVDKIARVRPLVNLGGGEPLLYPEIEQIARYILERHRLPCAMTTNGYILEQHAAWLVDAGMTSVFLSLDGEAAVHDRIRGREGAHDRAVAGLRALQQAKARAKSSLPKSAATS